MIVTSYDSLDLGSTAPRPISNKVYPSASQPGDGKASPRTPSLVAPASRPACHALQQVQQVARQKGPLDAAIDDLMDELSDDWDSSSLGDLATDCATAMDGVGTHSKTKMSDDRHKWNSSPAKEAEHSSPELVRTATPSEVEAQTDIAIDMTNMAHGEMANEKFMKNSSMRYVFHPRSAPYKRLKHPADKSLFLSFLGSMFFLLVALALLCPAVVIYVVILPLGYLIKRSLASCCCCTQSTVCMCCCAEMLTPPDILWLHDTPFNRMVSQAMFTLEPGLDIDRIKDLFHSKLVNAERKSGQKLYPRFTQKIVALFSGYVWVKDPEFSMDNHVYEIPDTVQRKDQLQSYIGDLAVKDLPRDRPLWDIHILCEYGSCKETVIILRLHPSLSDGISLEQILMKALVDNSQDAMSMLKPRFSQGALAFNVLRSVFVGPVVFLQKWLFSRRDHNFLHRRGNLSGRKLIAWSEPYSLSKAMRVKQVTRSTLNDILLTVTSGIIRMHLQRHNVANPYDIHITMPVDLRADDLPIQMGTKFALADLRLPTNTEGAIPRLWEIKHRVDELKNSTDPVVLYESQWLLAGILPQCLCSKIWSFIINKGTCFVSNLQGPEHMVTFSSREVKSMVYWMPPRDNVSLSISFLTYADQLRMSVIADSAVVPNPDLMTKDFLYQMQMLSELLSNRRIPGEHPVRRMDMSLHDNGLAAGEEPTVEQIQGKLTEVQQQLQELKQRLDMETQAQLEQEEHALMNRVEELKEEFRELLTELRRKKNADGSPILSEDSSRCRRMMMAK